MGEGLVDFLNVMANAERTTAQKRKSSLLLRTALPIALLIAVQCGVSSCGLRLKTSTEYLVAGNEYFKIGDYKSAEK